MTDIENSSGVALGVILFLVIVALYVWTALALSAVFRKSGQQAWKAWVPVLNQIVLLNLGGLSGWLYLLVLIPFAGPVILWGLLIVAYYRINLSFGHGLGMTVLAALLLPVWATILGFGPARWLGTEPGAAAFRNGPRRTAAPEPMTDDDVPRVAPPAYRPSAPLPAEPAGGWMPPPVPPAPPSAPAALGARSDRRTLDVRASAGPGRGALGRLRSRRRQRGHERGHRRRFRGARPDLGRAAARHAGPGRAPRGDRRP